MSDNLQEKNIQIEEEDCWKIIQNFFEKNGLVHQQINSFNDYINKGIQSVIDEEADIVIHQSTTEKYVLNFGEIAIYNPSIIEDDRNIKIIKPSECRIRDLNYDAGIFCDLTETLYVNDIVTEKHIHNRICIGRTPIMLRSDKCNLLNMSKEERIKAGECENDSGGYFINKGHERVIVAQLRGNYNQVIVLKQKDNEKYSHVAEIRSMSEETGHSVQLKVMIGNDERSVVFSLPYIKETINIGIVFKALGFTSDEEITKLINLNTENSKKYIRLILRDSFFIENQDEALCYIGQYSMHVIPKEKRKLYALQVVETELFPHLGISATVKEKGVFLGHIINKLLATKLGIRNPDDRDNYKNKRIETTGILFTELFRTLFKRYINTIKLQLEKKKYRCEVLSIINKINSITQGLKHSIATGNWGVQKNAYIRTGVSQILSRMTYGATLSHMRRIIIPVGKEGKNAIIRQIHSSQFGYICPAECFDPNTPILLWNGHIKLARDIIIGDCLIDDSGNCTVIKSTCFGYKKMYEVKQLNNGINYTVTDNHILTLKITEHNLINICFSLNTSYIIKYFDKNCMRYSKKYFKTLDKAKEYSKTITDDIIDITIKDYIKLPENIKNKLYGFKCSIINWPRQEIKLDPYNVGLNISNNEIPIEYIVNDCKTRYSVLSGIIDSIGYITNCICLSPIPFTKNNNILNLLLKSLGITYHISPSTKSYQLLCIDISKINTKILSIQENFSVYDSNCLLTSIKIIEKDVQEFVGWQLHGNGRFLLEDCTVVHNTPEGASAGIVLNFSLLAKVTKKIPTILIKEIIENNKYIVSISKFDIKNIESYTYVFLNGILVGMTQDPFSFVEDIKRIRKNNRIDPDVSISYNSIDEEIRIFSDFGRIIRPLFTVGKDGLNITKNDGYNWDMLVKKNLIEYIDTSEIENTVIAMKPSIIEKKMDWFHKHCEIHPSMILGVMGSIIPFPDHSPSPRNCYQCLDYNTLVLMGDGTKKPIKNINIGDKIITLNPVTHKISTTKVINHFIRSTDKIIKTITTISGRKITATDDHLFLTLNGWKKVEELTTLDCLCIIPYNTFSIIFNKNLEYDMCLKHNQNFCLNGYNKIILKTNNSLYVPIDSINITGNVIISDITTKSENHSFIAGDNFCVHNCSMGKQAIGVHALSYKSRTDTITHVLDYPQKPLVSTKPSQFMGFNEMPSGINAIVAILSYTGYNQEDSVIMNKASIDKGMFTLTSYRTVTDIEKKSGMYTFETIGIPPPSSVGIKINQPGYFKRKNANYSLLDERGVVKKGICVKKGDLIIGKILTKSTKTGEEKLNDCSICIKQGEEGIVDSVHIFNTPNGYKMVKVVIRQQRLPEIGDKVACYTPDHDILTDSGWIQINNLTTSHKVACMINNNTLEYHNPTEIQEYEYSGKMYNVESDKVSLCVTPNHRMYTASVNKKFSIQEASEIYGQTRSYKNNIENWNPQLNIKHPLNGQKPQNLLNTSEKKNTNNITEENKKHYNLAIEKFRYDLNLKKSKDTHYVTNTQQTFTLPSHEELPSLELNLEAWCLFFGIWIAEGSCSVRLKENGNFWYRTVKITMNKPQIQKQLGLCMNILNINCNTRMSKGKLVWYSGDRRLIHYLKPLSVEAINKYLPEWCFKLNMHNSKKLIEGIILGYGNYMENTTICRYYTSSINLRNDFQRMCLHAGWGCNYFGSPGDIIRKREIISTCYYWNLTVYKTQVKPLINKYIKQGKQLDSWIKYKGPVFCCTVPTDEGLVFVRRNGKSIWSGNSRSAQKGTIGAIYNQEDMPFNREGITPDIIINPHCIPSRMTTNQLMECVLGKACSIKGEYGDATPWTSSSTDNAAEKICELLAAAGMQEQQGYNRNGWEYLTNGFTGEPIKAKVFMGPTYYQRLKHMVADKIHSRSTGHVTTLVRQPLEGRSRDGGLRFGEMERDAMIAHGASRFLKERLFDCSDPYQIIVCDVCGMITSDINECTSCDKDKVSKCNFPFAAKLLTLELMAMGIKVAIKPQA